MTYFLPVLVSVAGLFAINQSRVFWEQGQTAAAVLSSFFIVIFLFVLHPILDAAFNWWKIKPQAGRLTVVSENLFRLMFPINLSVLLLSLYSIKAVFQFSGSSSEQWVTLFGMALSAGVLLGVFGINSAHEFIHRESRFERAMGVITLMMVNFASFRINHVDIHHRLVATPLDPTTARRGENLYLYWIRSYFSGWEMSWQFEKARLANHSSSTKVLFNRMIWYSVLALIGMISVFFYGGAQLLVAWYFISFVAIALLQTVDFVEHYGLLRKELKPGVYEVIKPKHSWDSDSFFTNAILFNLGLHSHHHTRSQLHFTSLRPSKESRAMKFGYSVMVLVALVPPVWRHIVDPQLDSGE